MVSDPLTKLAYTAGRRLRAEFPMQIVCPNCDTAYDVQPAALGASGRSVRCVRCRTTWFASLQPEPAMTEVAPPASPEPAASQSTPTKNEPDQAETAETNDFDWSFETTPPAGDAKASGAADATQAAGAGPAAGADLGQDDVDALFGPTPKEPVQETQAPSIVPAMEPEPAPPAPIEHHVEPENIEAIAARRTKPTRTPRQWTIKLPQLGMPVAITALAAMLVGLVGWRAEVVRFAPQTASLFATIGLPVNLRGLTWENVRTTGEVHEGVPVLIVEGAIRNISAKTVEVPRLRFALRSPAGHEIYAWTTVTARSILAPGETAAFRTRLASPPAEGRDVIVRFFNRRDLLAGAR
jgi:predicted Zn finger-like uncharacterized protein